MFGFYSLKVWRWLIEHAIFFQIIVCIAVRFRTPFISRSTRLVPGGGLSLPRPLSGCFLSVVISRSILFWLSYISFRRVEGRTPSLTMASALHSFRTPRFYSESSDAYVCDGLTAAGVECVFTSIVTTVQYRFHLHFCFEVCSALSNTVLITSTVLITPLWNPNCIFDNSRSSIAHLTDQRRFGSSTCFWIYHILGKLPSSRPFYRTFPFSCFDYLQLLCISAGVNRL